LIAYVRDKLAAERFPYSPALRPVKSAPATTPSAPILLLTLFHVVGRGTE
jgi:hypothetical protein